MPSDVNGTAVNRYFGEAQPLDLPVPLDGLQVEALVWQGGAWTTYPGSGHADGTFTIPAVPAGQFMLDVAGTYVYTTAHKIDLGTEISGRPTATQSSPGTEIGGDLQGLSAWQANDQIEWFDGNAGGGAYAFSGAQPQVNDTSLTKSEPSTWLGALIDSTKGDVLYATQLSSQAGPTGPYVVTRFVPIKGVQQADASLTTVMSMAVLAPVTADQTVSIDFRASEFAKLVSAAHPGAVKPYGAYFDLATLPGAAQAGFVGYEADLLLVYPNQVDVDLGTVHYANPFPAAWGTTVYAGESFSVSYTAPGASSPVDHYGTVYVQMPPAQASAGPVRPSVSPVQGPQIDGKSAFGSLAGISSTPVISWTPPALGQPTAYRVTLYQVMNGGGTSTIKYVTTVATTTTSVPFPPNVLQKGNGYVFVITAMVSPIDASTAPFRGSPTTAGADVLSSMAVP
jgi:hypothetical protein